MKNIQKIVFIINIILIIVCIGITSYAAYTINANQVYYKKSNNTTVSLESALNELYTAANSSSGARKLYEAGDIVRFGGEDFQVLYDIYEGQELCELFCKTNLNQAATAQTIGEYSSTGCKFSNEAYWTGNLVSGKDLNLNVENGFTSSDAMGKAKNYAKLKGALDGRLLTCDEADELKKSRISKVENMYTGTGNTVQGFEYYWLATSASQPNETYLDRVYATWSNNSMAATFSWVDSTYGVRPVLTVFTSQISSAS